MQELQAIFATIAPYFIAGGAMWILSALFPNLPKLFFDMED